MTTIYRLPEVRPLSQILPRGTEGGKEFARIVDLLLFYYSARKGESVNLFSDRSGDFYGLDSVKGGGFRQEKNIGYQYKFYPSPLTSAHRADIVDSIKKANANQKQLKLKRWILVTPDDLVQSVKKVGGGDVEWFTNLPSQLNLNFEVEHWGHRKLQALFLETPHLCLYYYPELIPHGTTTRSSFSETRKRYDLNLWQSNERIEFIGMSVYKAEATQGVPMEEIYIPVSVIPFTSISSTAPHQARTDPLTFLRPGSRHVILGDPGSGKSTLLRFLSIAGRSTRLQKKYGAVKDERIAISVTLRKYSDALKENRQLSLIEYISRSAQADYCVSGATTDFFEYHLESGQAIVLFDGMDELPDASFKQLARDRITAFLNCYPMTAAIITSRIVGYSAAFGFDNKTFGHFQMAPLLLKEIESFVRDWYRVRVENEAAREANIKDLIRILQNPEQRAIRTLAENPLLLTIVALVHRIDAVLPDERVFLYQKCTETLLNTWHTWKYKGSDDASRKGRIERTNRRRIEALAEYMHIHAGQTSKKSRAVLLEQEVLKVLVDDIRLHDGIATDGDAEDVAKEFLEFIKQKAGLLIEVGDRQYSFIHLTFQEYLTATALATKLELGGVKKLWIILKTRLRDPRWHEVIRLLIAGLKSDESQAFITIEIIKLNNLKTDLNTTLLLGGLLLDGVKSAEAYKTEILSSLFKLVSLPEAHDSNSKIVDLLSTLAVKHPNDWDYAFLSTWKSEPALRPSMLLLAIAIDIPIEKRDEITQPKDLAASSAEVEKFALLLGREEWDQPLQNQTVEYLSRFERTLQGFSRRSPFANFTACIGQAVFSNTERRTQIQKLFRMQLSVLRNVAGPFNDFYRNYSALTLQTNQNETPLKIAQAKAVKTYWELRGKTSKFEKKLNAEVEKRRGSLARASRAIDRMTRTPQEKEHIINKNSRLTAREGLSKSFRARFGTFETPFRSLIEELTSSVDANVQKTTDTAWRTFLSTEEVTTPYIDAIIFNFELEPGPLWERALRSAHIPNLIDRIPNFLSGSELDYLTTKFEKNVFNESDYLQAACFLFYDIWLFIFCGYSSIDESPLCELSKLTEDIDFPPLNIARTTRSLTFATTDSLDLKSFDKVLIHSGI